MKEIWKEAAGNLLTVKSIVTLVLTLVFSLPLGMVLALRRAVSEYFFDCDCILFRHTAQEKHDTGSDTGKGGCGMTGNELVAFARGKIGTPYVYGMKGKVLTQKTYDRLRILFGRATRRKSGRFV